MRDHLRLAIRAEARVRAQVEVEVEEFRCSDRAFGARGPQRRSTSAALV